MKTPAHGLSKADFEQLSGFRYRMRRFERFSEPAAQGGGITPLQYQLKSLEGAFNLPPD